jgi:hypothetical protein
MPTKDLTLDVLKSIRDEAKKTNERLATMDGRLIAVESGIKGLERRLVESEMRTATALTDLAGTVRELTTMLRGQHDLRPRVEQCERDILFIKERLPDA